MTPDTQALYFPRDGWLTADAPVALHMHEQSKRKIDVVAPQAHAPSHPARHPQAYPPLV